MLRSVDGDGRVRTALKMAAVTLAALVPLLLSPPAALAQRMHGGGGGHWGGHAGGFQHFNGAGGFRGGHFGHGHHRGHFGSVVVIGGGFGLWDPAFYPYPSYAYPYAYDPPVTYINMPPPAQVWYYCDAAGAYYPYVASCPGSWRQVPAVPPAPAQ